MAALMCLGQVVYTYKDGLRWAMQIASALAHLHAQRPLIIHRDLKLDNVLLTGAQLESKGLQTQIVKLRLVSLHYMIAKLACTAAAWHDLWKLDAHRCPIPYF